MGTILPDTIVAELPGCDKCSFYDWYRVRPIFADCQFQSSDNPQMSKYRFGYLFEENRTD
jgi:hypothetical protein